MTDSLAFDRWVTGSTATFDVFLNYSGFPHISSVGTPQDGQALVLTGTSFSSSGNTVFVQQGQRILQVPVATESTTSITTTAFAADAFYLTSPVTIYMVDASANQSSAVTTSVLPATGASAWLIGQEFLGDVSTRGSADPDVVDLNEFRIQNVVGGAISDVTVTDQGAFIAAAGVSAFDYAIQDGTQVGSFATVQLASPSSTGTVPDTTGMALADAQAAIIAAGFTSVVSQSVPSSTVPIGDVLTQFPVAGSILTLGGVVELTLSLGTTSVIVPTLTGLKEADAIAARLAAGLSGTVYFFIDGNNSGFVINQSVAPGTVLDLGAAVDLVVSSNICPDVVGLLVQDAESILTAANLAYDESDFIFVYDDTVPAQFVISQTPIAGVPVLPAQIVILTVSLGPSPNSGPWPGPYTGPALPGRGGWVLPGGQQALVVFGSTCYLVIVNTQATADAPATFKLRTVGSLSTNAGPVCIRDNGAGGYALIVDGPNGYWYNIATNAFAQVVDANFRGADRIAFIDGWLVVNHPGSQEFYTTTAQYSIQFSGSNFALVDNDTDLLITLEANKTELWLVGERHTEIWYDAGGQYFPFQRLVSTMIQVGCSAKNSIARYQTGGDSGLIWLGKSERGENVVIRTKDFSADSISTPAISNLITKFNVVSDAFAYVYQEAGHEFYVITFPTADKTLAYDLTTNMWAERASFDPAAGKFHRHRSAFFINFQDQRLVGDYQNGKLYRMDRSVYQDDIWPIVSLRRMPHIWDGGGRQRVFMASLQIQFSPGVGTQSGRGVDPHATLRISRDAGTTWGHDWKRTIGKVGQYLHRTIWRRISFARDSVIEVEVTAPVNRDIVGATLKAMSGQG